MVRGSHPVRKGTGYALARPGSKSRPVCYVHSTEPEAVFSVFVRSSTFCRFVAVVVRAGFQHPPPAGQNRGFCAIGHQNGNTGGTDQPVSAPIIGFGHITNPGFELIGVAQVDQVIQCSGSLRGMGDAFEFVDGFRDVRPGLIGQTG